MRRTTIRAAVAAAWLVCGQIALCPAADNDADKPVDRLTPEEIKAFRQYMAEKAAAAEKARQADRAERADIIKGIARGQGPAKGYSVWSNLEIEIYGYIKLDGSYDTSRTNAGNFARWVLSENGATTAAGTGAARDDDQFNMTANQTRLGLKITNPRDGAIKTRGQVEVDFFGAGAAENRPQPMMRHAYIAIEWPEQKFSIIAGQTWDVISPLNPSTVNYAVQWWAGNIGYRRPQIRLTQAVDLDDARTLTVQAAVVRAIGHGTFGGFDPGDTGEDAGFPGVQGRVAVTCPLVDGRKATVGLSGHFQPEEYDTNASGRNDDLCSWSANVDVKVPVNDWLTLQGEGFLGQNLDAFLGGIGQGIEVTTVGALVTQISEIRSMGGWVAAAARPEGPWAFNLGASGEMIDEDDVAVATTRTSNSTVFVNTVYQITDSASVAAEIANWYTQYKRTDSGHSVRFQVAFKYDF